DNGAADQTADVVPSQRPPFESARAAVGCEHVGDGDRQIAACQSNDCVGKAYLAKSAKWRRRKERRADGKRLVRQTGGKQFARWESGLEPGQLPAQGIWGHVAESNPAHQGAFVAVEWHVERVGIHRRWGQSSRG